MPQTVGTPVKDLTIDLENYRTVEQEDELQAIQAMIATSPDWFWALTESILDDGYLPTENIIVLKKRGTPPKLLVKEGNRRIAALKLIHGLLPLVELSASVPKNIAERVSTLPEKWKVENSVVPCTIYPWSEADVVDRIVTLTHGKGEKAGRDHWNAVARARHNRKANGASEPGLDLLEKYLDFGKNHTPQQGQRWAGDYPLTVLDEALKRGATRFGASSAPDLAKKYPKITRKTALDNVIKDIGTKRLGFQEVRGGDFLEPYGVPPLGARAGAGSSSSGGSSSSSAGGSSKSSGAGSSAASGSGRKSSAVATNDPRSVTRSLKAFVPRGKGRDKVVTLRDEMRRLKLRYNPLAFCFLLRSAFEISAKAYCADHSRSGGPTPTKGGQDKQLAVLLREIVNHLTQNSADKAMVKVLHGAMTQLGRQDGVLSVTSMNQLVHNPTFSVQPGDVSVLFNNIFPLLEAMNS